MEEVADKMFRLEVRSSKRKSEESEEREDKRVRQVRDVGEVKRPGAGYDGSRPDRRGRLAGVSRQNGRQEETVMNMQREDVAKADSLARIRLGWQ